MSGSPARRHQPRPRVAVVLAGGCLVVAAFQVALTLGAPLGAAALGGAHPGAIPGRLRWVTALSALVWLFAAAIVLARGGLVSGVPRRLATAGTWLLVGLLGVATLLNVASSSPWERFGWAPFSLAMVLLGLSLARSPAPASRTPDHRRTP